MSFLIYLQCSLRRLYKIFYGATEANKTRCVARWVDVGPVAIFH